MKQDKNATRPSGVSRRTVVKGAAWAVPAITVASAVPAYAVSGDITFTDLGQGRKLPGASCQSTIGITKGYAVKVQVCTSVPEEVTVTFGTATGTINGSPKTFSVVPNPLVLPASPGGTTCSNVIFGLQGEPDSSQAALSGSAPYTWTSATGSGSGTMTFSSPTTPPLTPSENCTF